MAWDTSSLTTYAKETAVDGIVVAAGLTVNDRWIASKIMPYLGSAGKYAAPVEGFLVGLGYRYAGEKLGKPELGRIAAAGLFGYKLAAAFSTGPLDPAATHGTIGAAPMSASHPRAWTSLSPVALAAPGGAY